MTQLSRFVQDTPRDPRDRDRLREEWRLAELAASDAEDAARRMKEGKQILLDRMVLNQIDGAEKVAISRAEMYARTSSEYKTYIDEMHDAMKLASDLGIEAKNKDRLYWESVSHEATERAERRNAR